MAATRGRIDNRAKRQQAAVANDAPRRGVLSFHSGRVGAIPSERFRRARADCPPRGAALRHRRDRRDHTPAGGARVLVRDPKGVRIDDGQVIARIKGLAVPPAWKDVWICTFENGHLQATGRDARRRKQYRYHPEWNRARGEDKFSRVVDFGTVLREESATVIERAGGVGTDDGSDQVFPGR